MWCAYSFRADLSLEQLLARLNEIGPWAWHERDNDSWGPYLHAGLNSEARRANIKVLHHEKGYAVVVHYHWDDPRAPAAYEATRKTLFEHILPSLGARDIAETEDYER